MKQPFSKASSPPLSQLKQNTETILLKMDFRHKEKTISKPSGQVETAAGVLSQDLQQCSGPGTHPAPAACPAAGSYGRWLEIIVFNNADHHQSSWEITLNITLGLDYRNIAKGNCPYDAQGLE